MTNKKTIYLIIGSVLVIASIPFILTRPAILPTLNFSETGQIGDTIGGLTAPIINLLGAILVYFSFQQQIKANEIQRKALDEEIKRSEGERRYNSIIQDINNLRADINDFRFTRGNIEFNGIDALFEFRSYCSASDKIELEHTIATPTFKSFYFLIGSTDNILRNILRSNLGETDKRDLLEKLIYLYTTKIVQDSVSILKSLQDKKVQNKFVDMLAETTEKLAEYILGSGI